MLAKLVPTVAALVFTLAAQAAGPPGDEAVSLRMQLSPVQNAVLAARMSGRIEEIRVKDGETFSKGDVLIRFDCRRAEAMAARARATYDKKSRIAQNTAELVKFKSASPLEAEVARAEAAEAQAEVRLAQTEVDRCVIAAPFSGRVAEVKAKAHETLAEGTPILEVLDDAELEIEMVAPAALIPKLTPKSRFSVRVEDIDRVFPAEIVRLGGKLDPVSRTIKLYGRLLERAPELKAGMSGAALF